MKLGVIQGRLSKPTMNHIQQFPKNWEQEFDLLKSLGLSYIEWLITTECFHDVLKIDALKYTSKIPSIGCDNLTNENIAEKDFLEEQLDPICQFVLRNKIKSITIPLLEKSKIDNFVDKFIISIEQYSKKYPQINFNFELESSYDIALELCKSRDNFYITYDIGNITACNYDHEEYINKCIKYIDTVHLKDKTINPVANVEPGTGNADFDLVFKTLSKHKYNDKFTLQTSRGKTGDEINTIQRHIDFFRKIWERHFNLLN